MPLDGPVSPFETPGAKPMALEGLICSGSPNRPQRAFAEPDGSMGIHGAVMLRSALPCPQTKPQSLIPQRRTW